VYRMHGSITASYLNALGGALWEGDGTFLRIAEICAAAIRKGAHGGL